MKVSKKNLNSKIKKMKKRITYYRIYPLEWIFKTINTKLWGHYQCYDVRDYVRNVQ